MGGAGLVEVLQSILNRGHAWRPPSTVDSRPGRGLGVLHRSARLLLSAYIGSRRFRTSAFSVDVRFKLLETTLTRIPEESGFYGLNLNCYALRNGVPSIFV